MAGKSNDIVVKVFLPSISDYDKYYDQFCLIDHKFAEDLMPADLGDPFTNYGEAFSLRNADKENPRNMWAAQNRGYRCTLPSFSSERGMVAGLKVPFNKNSAYVKSARKQLFTNHIHYNKGKTIFVDGGGWRRVEGELDVITMGGRPYMWANAGECKCGKTNIMDCFSVEYLGTAPTFENGDYGKDLTILQTIQDRVFATFSKAEREAVIRVVLSSADNYDKATPYVEYYMGNN